jgi:4-hydroxyphenylpyruvate dioxygenase-like putative hemolysin
MYPRAHVVPGVRIPSSAMLANAIIMARPQNKRITVRKHIKGIDHAVIAVRDLDSTQDTFRRMGFTLTPRGHHTLGSENHCVMLGQDYLELLMVPQRLPGREYYYDFARIGDGLAAIALKTDNARGAFGELTAAALAPSEPVDFSRPVQLAEGSKTASFRITQLGLEQTPGGQVFLCQHFTRDVVWRPEYQTHANTATGLAALAILSADLRATAAAYERLFDVKARAISEGLLIDTGDTPIAVVSEPALAKRLPGVWISARHPPCMAALFIRVTDRDTAERTLRAGGLHPTRMPDGSVAVGAAEAHGVAIIFG